MKTVAFLIAAAIAIATPQGVDAQYKCLGAATLTGQCGPGFGNAKCMRAGDYCSTFGWCGSTDAHKTSDQCGGASPGFYTCKGKSRVDNRCGKDYGGSGCAKAFDYCSSWGWCGNTTDHKASDQCGGPSPGGDYPGGSPYKCLGAPTLTGQCGPNFGNARCMREGDYCSQWGWCGATDQHKTTDQCGGIPSPGFYTCKGAARADNRCGPNFGNAGCAKAFDFCSSYGWCGSTSEHKSSDQCGGPSPGFALPATPAPVNSYKCMGAPTLTGQCGPNFGMARCMREGDFCSQWGWCGATDQHKSSDQCGGIASPGFYTCKAPARSDNRCGVDFGGAGCNKPFDFCSKYGWCGNTADHQASDQCGGPSPGIAIATSTYKCGGEPTLTGQCGPGFGNAKCMRAGDYCSTFGWCGSTDAHKTSDQCGGPSPGFYTCKGTPRADNRCGRDFGGAGCAKAFDFCSVYGWCGNTADHKATDQCGGPSPGGSAPGA